MATKADIVLTATDKASKVIKTVEDGLRGVGGAGKGVIPDLVTLRQEWGYQVSTMLQAGQSMEAVATATGLTRGEVEALAAALRVTTAAVDDVTGAVDRQADSMVRMPQYLVGSRGGWLNLIATMVLGVSVYSLAHKALEKLIEPITKGTEELEKFQEQLLATSPTVEQYVESARQAEKETLSWQMIMDKANESILGQMEAVKDLASTQIRTNEEVREGIRTQIEAQREQALATAWQVYWTERLVEEYAKLIAQDVSEEFEKEKQAIFEVSRSSDAYAKTVIALAIVQGKLPPFISATTRELLEEGLALEYAARQAEKARAMFERLMGTLETISGITSAVGDYVRDLGDAQETYADRTEDILFRAGQAWESYAFRVGQAMAALNFRLNQAQDKFDFSWGQRQAKAQHAAASRAARAGAAVAAAAARHHLRLETITQDHHDKLEDMEKKHQEEMRRFLQRAPWYLQREIRDYQKEKKALEAKGDKEGLAQLKKAFIERMRAIDPIYAEELERLEELQQDERDVEDREFNQRLRREKKQFAISRAQAAANAAIALADAQFALDQQNAAAIFAYEQWLKAQEFSQEQRLASMKFSYEQQAEASARALEEAEEDRKEALERITEDFNKWAKDEMRKEYMRWFKIGYQGLKGYYEGRGEEAPDRPTPKPPGGGGRKQMGMPYVPATMPVVVHTGEAILRRDQAAAWRGGEHGGEIIINFYGPVYMRTGQEVRRLATDISRELGRRVYVRR